MSDARNCLTCSAWKPTYDKETWYVDELSARFKPEGWGECERITHGWGGPQHSVRAFTLDASNYESGLFTRSDFGCAEWTPVALSEEPPQ